MITPLEQMYLILDRHKVLLRIYKNRKNVEGINHHSQQVLDWTVRIRMVKLFNK